MTEFLTYAPIILVVIGFCIAYKVFITPAMLEERLKEKRKLIENEHVKVLKECSKIYTTKEEMQIERKKLLEAVASDYLEKAVFEIAQRRIDDKLNNTEKRFDKIDANVEKVNENVQHIIDLMIQKNI